MLITRERMGHIAHIGGGHGKTSIHGFEHRDGMLLGRRGGEVQVSAVQKIARLPYGSEEVTASSKRSSAELEVLTLRTVANHSHVQTGEGTGFDGDFDTLDRREAPENDRDRGIPLDLQS